MVWGPTGTGKTYGAIKYMASKFGNDFHVQRFRPHVEEWWDGYVSQPGIIIEEFEGSDVVSYSRLLAILDRYQLLLPVKGGFKQARFKEVIFTSNRSPEDWYCNRGETSELDRRLAFGFDEGLGGMIHERTSLGDPYPIVHVKIEEAPHEVIEISDEELSEFLEAEGMEG